MIFALRQAFRHPQTRRTQRASLTIVNDPANRRTIIEYSPAHAARPPPSSPCVFDLCPRGPARPHAPSTLRARCLANRGFSPHCTFAWLSNSSTAWPNPPKKWLPQYRCGTPGHTLAIVLTNASCLSDIHIRTRQRKRFAQSSAWTIGANLLGRVRQKRLRKPDTLASKFTHDIERLMPFLPVASRQAKARPRVCGIFLSQQWKSC